MTDHLTDHEMREMGEAMNDARGPLLKLARLLESTGGNARVTLPLPVGAGYIALLVTDEQARKLREVIG